MNGKKVLQEIRDIVIWEVEAYIEGSVGCPTLCLSWGECAHC